MTRRIVSLLPSATEIVCALGAAEELVGISHECDYPRTITHLPVLTSAKMKPSASSATIDRSVRDVVRDALAVYDIDTETLTELAPTTVVTQDLCDVCAVSYKDVCAAVAEITTAEIDIVNLNPTKLEGIFADIERTGAALGRSDEAATLLRDLRRRIEAVRARVPPGHRPKVLSIEWIDPVMIGGTWMPELIHIAGGEALVTAPGDHAPTLGREELADLRPDVVLIKPCGFDLERSGLELHLLADLLPLDAWPAAENERIFLADGNAYFNRPGPRIVDSLEIMAACLHPEAFADFADRYAADFRRIDPYALARR